MTPEKTVLQFISKFQTPETRKVFTQGCCYWFAKILADRFIDTAIIYNPVLGHFGTEVGGLMYDIEGLFDGDKICTGQWYYWDSYSNVDQLDYDRVVQYCVLMQDGGDLSEVQAEEN